MMKNFVAKIKGVFQKENKSDNKVQKISKEELNELKEVITELELRDR